MLLPPNETETGDYFAAQRRTSDAIVGAVKDSSVPHVVMLSSLGAELADGTGPIKSLHYLENTLRATGTKLIGIRACYFQENIAGVIPGARKAGILSEFSAVGGYRNPDDCHPGHWRPGSGTADIGAGI